MVVSLTKRQGFFGAEDSLNRSISYEGCHTTFKTYETTATLLLGGYYAYYLRIMQEIFAKMSKKVIPVGCGSVINDVRHSLRGGKHLVEATELHRCHIVLALSRHDRRDQNGDCQDH